MNKIDKLTDTQILELASYTKHIKVLMLNYNSYIKDLLGSQSYNYQEVNSIKDKLDTLKSNLYLSLEEKLKIIVNSDIVKNKLNKTITSIDIFYGGVNLNNDLIKDFSDKAKNEAKKYKNIIYV